LPEVGDTKVDLFYGAVGKKIRAARINAGLSQTVLARLIGFNRSSVANLEAGRQRIALHLFALIAEALRIDPAMLMPDIHLLDDADMSTIENLNKHLVGTSETTQNFVRGAIAQVTSTQRGEGG
jgi:transcriptional regulator with XRE-family HTH domain